MNTKECLKCGHDISSHIINIIGRYDFLEISCKAEGEEYQDQVCGCDAGFRKVQIKKEFTSLNE